MVFEEVRKIISDHLKMDEDEIKMESKLEDDLQMDSLDMLDLDVVFEENLGVKIEEMEGIETVGDIVKYVEEKKA